MSERLVPRRGAKPWQQQAITQHRRATDFAYEQVLRPQEKDGFAQGGAVRDPQAFSPLTFKSIKGPLSPQAAKALAAFEAAERAQRAQAEVSLEVPRVRVKAQPPVQPFFIDPLLRRPGFTPDVFEWEAIEVEEEPFDWGDQTTLAHQPLPQAFENAMDGPFDGSGHAVEADPVSDAALNSPADSDTDGPDLAPADWQALENPAVDLEAMQRVVDVARHHGETEGERKAQEALAAQRAALLHEQAEMDRQRELFAQEREAESQRRLAQEAQLAELQKSIEDQLAALEASKTRLEAQAQDLQRERSQVDADLSTLAQEREEMQARRAAMAADLEDLAKGRAGIAQEVADQRKLFEQASAALNSVLDQPEGLYEPLKRLALSLAERIALAEIQSNVSIYATLIERSLETLDMPAKGLVVIDLHPEDKTRLEAALPQSLQGMRLNAVETIQPGSVRVYANDAIIDDFIAHRLEALARTVLKDPQAWLAHSTLVNPTDDSETPDVHP